LLLSTIVVVSGDEPRACTVTVPDVLGPYYQQGAPIQKGYVCQNSPANDRLQLWGQVQKADCFTGLPATLDVWQANEAGYYSEGASRDSQDYLCRAVILTDDQGYFNFRTRMPGRYDDDGYRPAHIHFKVTPRDASYDPLITQLYFFGDAYLGANDSCGRCQSGDPTLQAHVIHNRDIKTYEGSWNVVMKPRATAPTSGMHPQRLSPTDSYTTIKPHIQGPAAVSDIQQLQAENAKLRDTLAQRDNA
jgi:protocatechuate 3,4-dioxygenase beta subunit